MAVTSSCLNFKFKFFKPHILNTPDFSFVSHRLRFFFQWSGFFSLAEPKLGLAAKLEDILRYTPFRHQITMDNCIMISVKHRGSCKLVSVDQNTLWTDFVNVLTTKWPDLVGKRVACTCSVAALSDVSLDTDDDLTNLFRVCKMANVYMVKAEIDGNQSPSIYPIPPDFHQPEFVTPTVQTSPSGGSSVCSGDRSDLQPTYTNPIMCITYVPSSEFCGRKELPTYDICPAVKRKPMLSDGWSDFMKKGVGQVFRGGAAEFRVELIKYAAHSGFKFYYKRNDARYIHALCKEDQNAECEWFVKAKRQSITNWFELSHANFVHKCVGKLAYDDNKRLGTHIMGKLLLPEVKSHPNLSGKTLIKTIKENYGFELPYWKAHRSAEIARSQIYGSFDESYNDLRWYTNAVQLSNPGSITVLETDPISHHFERVFIGYKACIDGFRSCRPLLFIDGTFMKGRAKGVLLLATAKDGDNGLFPIAFAVVSAENTDNWQWFLELIRDNVTHSEEICFVSDRNLGLLAAFPIVFDKVNNFFCLYHLLTNLKGRMGRGWTTPLKEKVGDYFKACAYAPTKRLFDEAVANFLEVGGEIAAEWLADLDEDYDKWAVAYSPNVKRYGEMTSNAAESFNMWIKGARSLPIMAMFEDIRKGLSKWYVDRRKACSSWTGVLVESKQNLWYYLLDAGRTWFVLECPNGDFEVTSNPSVRVDLQLRVCSCHQWQVTGFPCVHAAAVIRSRNDSILDHVDRCFYKEMYMECYKGNINPIPDTMKFECQGGDEYDKILKPNLKRQPGRPKGTKRRPSFGETPNRKKN